MSKNTPKDSVSSLLRKELGGKKLATVNEDKTRNPGGDISFDKILKIAKEKEKKTYGDMKAVVKQVLGTCVSCGVTVDGKDPRNVIREVDEGILQVK
jgi:large subunit ribosomal protein L11